MIHGLWPWQWWLIAAVLVVVSVWTAYPDIRRVTGWVRSRLRVRPASCAQCGDLGDCPCACAARTGSREEIDR